MSDQEQLDYLDDDCHYDDYDDYDDGYYEEYDAYWDDYYWDWYDDRDIDYDVLEFERESMFDDHDE